MSSATNQFDNYTIIHLSFTIAIAQMIIILLLLFETPFRNPLLLQLDQFKIGKPQFAVKSFGATLFVAMMYNICNALEIRRRFADAVDSSNHIVLAYHMFVAYLMGFSLFLLVAVNSLHRYIKEVVMVTETIRAAKKQNRAYENCMKKNAEEAEIIRKDISRLKTEITYLESECSMKEQAVQLLRGESSTLKNKLEGCLEEYNRLLTYNKDLKEQLKGTNERSSHSDGIISAFFSWDGGVCDVCVKSYRVDTCISYQKCALLAPRRFFWAIPSKCAYASKITLEGWTRGYAFKTLVTSSCDFCPLTQAHEDEERLKRIIKTILAVL